MNKMMFTILRILDKYEEVVGSAELSRELLNHGIELSERTVRYYLKLLDQMGMTRIRGKRGRVITEKGKGEVSKAFVSERIKFVISKIDSLSYLTDFNIDSLTGNIILNISFFPEHKLKDAVRVMAKAFDSPYVMSRRIAFAKGGERIGDVQVPRGYVGLGTVCSITLNGIFLKSGIPVTSRYGGVVEIRDGVPSRFTSLISYEGSSMDPLEILIKSRTTDVIGAIAGNNGRILASFREIPVVSIREAEILTEKMSRKEIGRNILFGKPNQPLLDVPVGIDKVGMIVVGGLNPVAAAEEAGIFTENRAMSTLYEYSRLLTFNEAASDLL
ncbi:MAG: NrpR regulatory domain-containing protein [Syntrophorhabdaceae bacterium]|nr:NrpR regulatory domain-containing protein [Syntrophorhabdaceae bacterium]